MTRVRKDVPATHVRLRLQVRARSNPFPLSQRSPLKRAHFDRESLSERSLFPLALSSPLLTVTFPTFAEPMFKTAAREAGKARALAPRAPACAVSFPVCALAPLAFYKSPCDR